MNHIHRVVAQVLDKPGGGGRDVGVVLLIKNLRVNDMTELKVMAFPAKIQVEGVGWLRNYYLDLFKEVISRRRWRECHHLFQVAAIAHPASSA